MSHNVANTGTVGFKAQMSFQSILDTQTALVDDIFSPNGTDGLLVDVTRMEPGKLSKSDRPFDFAIAASGFFALSDPVSGEIVYSRQGSFSRDADGYLADPAGRRVQSVSHTDIRLSGDSVRVDASGFIFEGARPVDRIGVFAPNEIDALEAISGTEFAIAGDRATLVPDSQIRQGMTEMSNVSLPIEMIQMMEAIRQAETGSRIMQTYDTLIGQAISAFGRS